jgi:Tfp pilus assembly protein PilN
MVEIIPKKVDETPSWQKILFYVLVLVAVLLIITYFVLFYLQNQAEVTLSSLEARLQEVRDPEVSKMEAKVISYKKKVDDFAPFLNTHIMNSNFFNFLERNAHPQVVFKDLSLNADIGRVTLSGKTDNFLSLGQQLAVLDESPMVKNLVLSHVSLNDKGGVDFNLNLLLDENIFRY